MFDLFFEIEGEGVDSGWVSGVHPPRGNDLAQVTGFRGVVGDLEFDFVGDR